MKKFFTLAAACLFGAAAFAQEGENEYIVVDTVLTYDFVTAGAPLPLANLNCSWAFYSYENAEKLDSRRQDYKGYEADANSKAVGLPDECHVWVRNPRLVQNLTANGLYFGQARNFVVDGLVVGSKVVVEYSTTSEVEGEQALRYDNSEGSKTQCSIDGTVLEGGVSTYASGATITVDTTAYDNGKTGLDGYVSFFVFKETSISKVTITNPDDGSLILDDARDGGFTYRSNTWFWSAGINYFATPKLTLIAQYSGSTRSGKLTHWGLHELLYLGMDSVVNELQHEPVSDRSNHNATAGLTYKPDAGRTFTFTVSYSHRTSDNMRTITLTPAEGNETVKTTHTQNSYNLWDGEANYSFPLLGSEIEVGTNLSWIGNKYSYAFSGSTQPSHRDDFTGAWYGSWKRTYGNWKPEVGLRLVYNDSRLKQGDNVDDKKEKRTSVRPHASLLYTISDNYQLKAQYSISGGFPSISQLNPAIVYESMLHYSKGNPDLKQYTWHYASLSANLKDFSVEASFGCTLHDIFTAILPYGSDYSIIDYPVNSRYSNTWALYADYSHTFGKVSVNASLSGCLFHTKFDRMEGYLNPPTSSQSMSAYAQARWQFCKSGEFYGSVRYTSPMQVDLTRSGRSLGINLGYTQRFLDNRLRVTVEGRDLLNQAITPRWSQNYGHVSQWQRNRYDTRGVTLRVQYVFNTLNNGYRNARINKQSDQRAN